MKMEREEEKLCKEKERNREREGETSGEWMKGEETRVWKEGG